MGLRTLAGVLLAIAGMGRSSTDDTSVAVTDCGPVAGAQDERFGGYAFRGIPYAEAPLGRHRWKRSQLLSASGGCWTGTLDTTWKTVEYMETQRCAQNPRMNWNQVLSWDGTEDCLTLDVNSPMTDLGTLRPVLVLIHGGGLMSGGPRLPYALRNEGFVVVSIRYRLNVLGFLALRELSAHDPKLASGNYGFSDQVTALQWVQANVKVFGGDSSRVTILGCSAGGSSIWNLLAIPSARGLFSAAIPLSAASSNHMTLAKAQHQNGGFVDQLCGAGLEDRYHCLMHLSLGQIMGGCLNMMGDSFPNFNHPDDFQLPSAAEYEAGVCIVDGVVVKEPLHVALRKHGSHSQVPVLSGSCSQEGDTHSLSPASTEDDFENVVKEFSTTLTTAVWPAEPVKRILELYPPTSPEFFGMPKAAMDAMIADIRVVCGTVFNAERLVEGYLPHTPDAFAAVWLYYVTMDANDGQEMWHCKSIGTLREQDCNECSPDEQAFYNNMVLVHSAFIRTGAPPAGTLHRFAEAMPHAKGNYTLNTIGSNITTSTPTLKERCKFWQETHVLKHYAWVERL